jgi:hypothetical protein
MGSDCVYSQLPDSSADSTRATNTETCSESTLDNNNNFEVVLLQAVDDIDETIAGAEILTIARPAAPIVTLERGDANAQTSAVAADFWPENDFASPVSRRIALKAAI